MINLLVGVFPSINSQQRLELTHNRILVSICLDTNVSRSGILDQPSPSTSLNACQRRVELLLELVQASISLLNRLGQRTCRRFTTALVLGSKVLPEERVIEVASAVEVDQRLQCDLCGNVVVGLSFFQLSDGGVVRVDVGRVVLVVMQLHDLAGDGWFEGTIVVCFYFS
jgi:hypothetical protein